MKEIIIYTDGSSKGNPGPGGWASVVLFQNSGGQGKVWELGGREAHTTNNRMELRATIEALHFVDKREELKKMPIIVHTDSAYVLNGITTWVYSWQKNGWRTADKKEVLNQDLWKELLGLAMKFKLDRDLSWKKVAGHSGVEDNERCDVIATSFADGERPMLFVGSIDNYLKYKAN